MYGLKYYQIMMELLKNGFESYLKHGQLAMAYLNNWNDMPPILLVCKSCPLSLTFIHLLVSKVHGLDDANILPLTNIGIEGVSSNPYMFQIEMRNHHVPELFDFVINLCQQQRPTGQNLRHIVVINMIDKMKPATALGLKSILTRFSCAAHFILRNDTGFYVSESVRVVVQPIKLMLHAPSFQTDFYAAISCSLPLGQTDYNDPMAMCIAAEAASTCPLLQFNAVQVFVCNHMDKLLATADKSLDTFGKHLRDFCIKIGAAGVPIATIAFEILKWTRLKTDTDCASVAILHILAEMDHGAAIVSKPLFILESCVNEIVHYINDNALKVDKCM